jgi:hypothetical protein
LITISLLANPKVEIRDLETRISKIRERLTDRGSLKHLLIRICACFELRISCFEFALAQAERSRRSCRAVKLEHPSAAREFVNLVFEPQPDRRSAALALPHRQGFARKPQVERVATVADAQVEPLQFIR